MSMADLVYGTPDGKVRRKSRETFEVAFTTSNTASHDLRTCPPIRIVIRATKRRGISKVTGNPNKHLAVDVAVNMNVPAYPTNQATT